METRHFHLGALLRLVLGGSMLIITALMIAEGYRELSAVCREIMPAIHFDTAAELGVEFLALRDRLDMDSEAPEQAALEAVQKQAARVLPANALVLVEADGRISAAAGNCRRIRSQLDPEKLALIAATGVSPERFALPSPCEDLAFLSAASISLPDRRVNLFVVGPSLLSEYLLQPEGRRVFYLRVVLPALLIFLAALLLLEIAYRVALRDAAHLAASTRALLGGKRDFKLARTASAEFAEVSRTLDKLAAEHQASTKRIEEDIAGRQVLMANLLHDLLTPMTSMLSSVERLAAMAPQAAVDSPYLGYLRSSLDAERSLAHGLRELAFLEEAVDEISPAAVDLMAVLFELKAQVSALAEQKSLSLVIESTTRDTVIEGDRVLIGRCLLNLLSNALRFTPPGGRITARVFEREGQIAVEISDSGIGIPEEEQERVFDDFYRSAGGKAHAPGGSGVGLSVVRRIAELHGAEVALRSRLGEGTTFTTYWQKIWRKQSGTTPSGSFAEAGAPPLDENAERLPVGPISLRMLATALLSLVVALVGVIYAEASPSTIWLSAVAVLLYAANAIDEVKRLRRGRMNYAAAIGVLALLCVIAANERSHVAVCAVGIAVSCVVSRAAGSMRALYGLAVLLAIGAISYYGALQKPVMLLGLGAGGFFSLVARIQDRSPLFKRLGFRTAGLLLLFCGGIALAVLAGVWSSYHRIASVGAAATASGISEVLAQELSVHMRSREVLHQQFAENYRTNPFFDFLLFFGEGYGRSSGHLALTSRSYHVSYVKPPAEPLAEPQMSVAEGEIDPVLERRRRMYFRHFCLAARPDTCLHLALKAPGDKTAQTLDRLAGNRIFYLLFSRWYLPFLVLLAAGYLLNRRIGAVFSDVRRGLERYRRGDYSRPVGVAAEGPLGELLAGVDELASRLPALTGELRQRQSERSAFMRKMAGEIERTIEELRQYVPQEEILLTQQQLGEIKACAEEQRQILESVFELQRLELKAIKLAPEAVNVVELLEEAEYAVAHDLRGAEFVLDLTSIEESPVVFSDTNYLARALTYFIKAAGESAGDGSRVRVTAEHSGDLCELRISAGVPMRLPYSWHDVYREAIERTGGALTLEGTAQQAAAVIIRLPRSGVGSGASYERS